jgi:hypothetical protein
MLSLQDRTRLVDVGIGKVFSPTFSCEELALSEFE